MQKELFKEFEAAQRRAKKKAQGSILPKNYLLINISYEQVIFITIGVIMLMVLVFSLGVERGRRAGATPSDTPEAAIVRIVETKIEEPAPEPVEPETKEEPVEERPVVERGYEGRVAKPVQEQAQFTIQVIAYRSKKSAQKEIMKLTKKGYTPFIILGGGYYQICVGEYKSQKEAKADLSTLKKTHPDSFLRKR